MTRWQSFWAASLQVKQPGCIETPPALGKGRSLYSRSSGPSLLRLASCGVRAHARSVGRCSRVGSVGPPCCEGARPFPSLTAQRSGCLACGSCVKPPLCVKRRGVCGLRRCTSTTACCWSTCLATGRMTRTRCASSALPTRGLPARGAHARMGKAEKAVLQDTRRAREPQGWRMSKPAARVLAGAPVRAGHRRERPGAAADRARLPGPLWPRLPRAGGRRRAGGLGPILHVATSKDWAPPAAQRSFTARVRCRASAR